VERPSREKSEELQENWNFFSIITFSSLEER